MAKYIIGDVQGCYDTLMALLIKIKFDTNNDKLIFCGDIVNRGGQSLQTLRWIFAHQDNCQITLGNHDLSLLYQYYIPELRKSSNIEFKKIFAADDCDMLMSWLCKQNILLNIKKFNTLVVHAGIYPYWSLKRAKKEAKRIEKKLQKNPIKLFSHMYGSKPNHWSKSLKGEQRTRFAINCFTRMRFLFKNAGLNFKEKGEISDSPRLIAWFDFPKKVKIKPKIIFGHWSALGLYNNSDVLCLDTGKVWGGQLTALKLVNKNLKKLQFIQV